MVYKECNVGSAKPSNSILKKHPHHLVNHVSLNRIFSVADFYQTAMKLIDSIHDKNKVPLLVGGSMMYFNLLKNGLSILPSANKSLREYLETRILEHGIETVYADLTKLDPKAAKKIKPQDTQRIIRAIEVVTATGKSMNANFASKKPFRLKERYELIEFGIFPEERSKLHKRIESRQGKLVGDSLLEEINEIKINFDVSSAHPAMKAINYKQGLDVIEGKIEKSELFEKSLFATRQFAKRQCTWMRGWENLISFDLHQRDEATEELKKQLNLL